MYEICLTAYKNANFISHFSVRKIFHNPSGLFHINEVDISFNVKYPYDYDFPEKRHLRMFFSFGLIARYFVATTPNAFSELK